MNTISLDNAALLVVDMQVDFVDGSLPVGGATDIIPTVNLWIEIFEDLEQPILYSLDWHPHTTPHFDCWPVHCVAGSEGAQIHPDVIFDPVEMASVYTILKGQKNDDGYSALSEPSEVIGRGKSVKRSLSFYNVESVLNLHDVRTVVVVGLATDHCVRATVLDLLKLGLDVALVRDGIAGVDEQESRNAVTQMARAGATFITKDGEPLEVDIPALV